jgi:hypothetical protein
VERIPAHIASPTWYRLSAKAERSVVEEARLIVLNTDAALGAMQGAYPEAAGRMLCVMNGCDDDPVPAPDRAGRFVVAYAGSIYLDRDPRPLFQAARRVVSDLGLTPERFAIEFMGHAQSYGGKTLSAIAAEESVGAFVRVQLRGRAPGTEIPRRCLGPAQSAQDSGGDPQDFRVLSVRGMDPGITNPGAPPSSCCGTPIRHRPSRDVRHRPSLRARFWRGRGERLRRWRARRFTRRYRPGS